MNDSTTPTTSLTRRRMQKVVWILVLAVGFAGGGFLAAQFMATPAQRDATAEAPPRSVITAEVVKRVLSDSVVTRGDVVVLESVDVLAGRTFAADMPVITAAPLSAGAEAAPGVVILEVNGRPVFSLPGVLPAYQDLEVGATGPLVKQLQVALRGLGSTISDADGVFGPTTEAAVQQLYDAAGYPAQTVLPRSEVAFLPTLPAKVVSSTAQAGKAVSAATFVVAAGNPVVTVSQPDAQLLAIGRNETPARLANELTGESVEAKFQPELITDQAGGAQLVLVGVEPIPLAWLGSNVRITVEADTTTSEVLAVPSAAISLNAEGQTIVIMVRGSEQEEVPVRTGVNGEGYTEVDGEIAEGDNVLVGFDR
ncbi:Peptidoglycan-binding (PGRP) domain of peptidoglycan hydrolases-containing protein [Tessaracoccus bendigoensis DSM 12906]|uniref:Peptidoglycan-binding (PGRP) domain of peptidoglycan hydrolases-containing protein n=1 Tax=Tessaracoccus bendigoensis DSM 12906 TaxID=1123357 RepID=A0A1M6NEK6_9ACTN|nr:peptidoglycan-binding protein [Tessaracoccus bendigoensis]SHJ94171.1 Peptidoglycan-binding (PGRP) domain of peptidoglycan hydrolases-containing protein [Tessaracoccus bendigoensis DSM 12906]